MESAPPPASRRASRLAAASACLVVLVLAAFSPRWIPYCMDEFVHYNALACATHPLTRKWSTSDGPFREPCAGYDLRLPFTSSALPLRAYHYIGSFPALPFLPFWLLGDPVAVRLQGALFLLATSALLARLTGARFLELLLAACVFPAYALAFVVDLGPVGLSLTLLGLAMLSVRAALDTPLGRQLGFGAAAGLLFFLGFWTKLVFAWVVPALLVFGLLERRAASARLPERGARAWLPGAGAAAFCAALPSLLLLLARDADGDTYLTVLSEGNFSAAAAAQDLGLHPLLRISRYLRDGSFVLPRTLSLPHWPVDVLPMLLAAAVLALAIRHAAVKRFLVLSGVTLAATLTTRSVWGPHHAAFAIFFLVGALGAGLAALRQREPRVLLALAGLLSLYWISLAARLPAAEIHADTSFGKDSLLRFVRQAGLGERAVQAHTSWGTFYIELLFGAKHEIVLAAPAMPVKPELIDAVKNVAAVEGREIAVISLRDKDDILTQPVRAALGAPIAERRFQNWWLVEFGR